MQSVKSCRKSCRQFLGVLSVWIQDGLKSMQSRLVLVAHLQMGYNNRQLGNPAA